MSLHPILAAAGRGCLPDWSQAGPERVSHMGRVAALLGDWAAALGCADDEALRWRAAGFLHDVVRDADPDELRAWVAPDLADLPGNIIHGPAAAARLRREGVADEAFLRAVAYHTIGHPELDRLGRSLYAADFLEPGRKLLREWRKELRDRMPGDLGPVLREVAKTRVGRLLEKYSPMPRETFGFWNSLVGDSDG